MSPEEEEVSLVVQCNDLPALELRHGREESLEETADGVAKAGDEAVQDELGVVGCGACMSLGTVSTS